LPGILRRAIALEGFPGAGGHRASGSSRAPV